MIYSAYGLPARTNIGKTTSRTVSRPPQASTTDDSNSGTGSESDDLPVSLRRRLRPEKVAERRERHRIADLERRRLDLAEWKRHRSQLVDDELPLGTPVRPDDDVVKVRHRVIDRGDADTRQVIAPRDERAVRTQHAPRLVVELVERQPVQRLRDGDDVHRAVRQAAAIRERLAIRDPRVRRRVTELLGIGVGRFDVREIVGEPYGSLSAACRAVPRERVAVDDRADPLEQRARIARPELRVILRDRGELRDRVGAGRVSVRGQSRRPRSRRAFPER